MSIITAIAIYFVIWWLCIFMVLPWGIKSQHEEDNVVEGSEPGAPAKPMLKRKILQTTILAFIVWAAIFLLVKYKILTLDSFPFIPDFTPKEI